MTAEPRGVSRLARFTPSLALVPFLAYLSIFLVIPTVTVVAGAFAEDGRFSLANVRTLGAAAPMQALWNSVVLSGTSALIGAVFGALLAYLVVTMPTTSLVRRTVTSVSGVLAQFGGVTLAFAYVAMLSFSGVLTLALRDLPVVGFDLYGSGWLYALPGLIVVYVYFQIPLMVIVFLPALEGLRPQWREAAVNLGASTRQYWTQVAIPLLRPAFVGSTLLLFANAFAAYATAAALVSQGAPITPLLIRSALISEIILGRQNFAFALALEMIVVVGILMGLYSAMLRRTSRWLR